MNFPQRCIITLTILLVYSTNITMCFGRNDSIHKPVHQISIEERPGYIFPTNIFLKGKNALGRRLDNFSSTHIKYGFSIPYSTKYYEYYPNLFQGIGLSYNLFENRKEIGTPVSLYIYQTAPVHYFNNKISLNYEWNFGCSFGWKPYDKDNNPNNRVIGTKANAYINFGLYLNYRINSNCFLSAGTEFTHFSNGNTKYPNSGMNIMGARIGITHTCGNITANSYSKNIDKTSERKNGFNSKISYDLVLYGSWRRKGFFINDVPHIAPGKFGVLGFNINPLYKFNRLFKAGLSLDGQYDESANITRHIGYIESPHEMAFYRPPLKEQIGIGLSARGEFSMPFFSINAGIGHYVFSGGDDMKSFYQIVAIKTSVTKNLFIHVGYQLYRFKDPNNLMLGIGYRFNNHR